MNKKYLVKQLLCDYNDIYFDSLIDDLENNFNNDIHIGFNKSLKDINFDIIDFIEKNIIDYSDYEIDVYYRNNIAVYIIENLKYYKKISLKQALSIAKLIKQYNKDRKQLICDILSIMYCKKYEYTVLRGYSQSDYLYCIYSSDIDYQFIQYIEAVLFNTGIEIYISSEKIDLDENESLINDDILYDGYSDYMINYFNTTEKKKYIADVIGCSVDEIAFYEINDVKTITTYKISYTEVQ